MFGLNINKLILFWILNVQKVIFYLTIVVAIRIVFIFFIINMGRSPLLVLTWRHECLLWTSGWHMVGCLITTYPENIIQTVIMFINLIVLIQITSNKWITKSKRYCFTTMNHIVFILPVSTIMYWQDKHTSACLVSQPWDWNADFSVTKKGKWPETNKFQAISIFTFLDNVSVLAQRFASLLTVLLYSGW